MLCFPRFWQLSRQHLKMIEIQKKKRKKTAAPGSLGTLVRLLSLHTRWRLGSEARKMPQLCWTSSSTNLCHFRFSRATEFWRVVQWDPGSVANPSVPPRNCIRSTAALLGLRSGWCNRGWKLCPRNLAKSAVVSCVLALKQHCSVMIAACARWNSATSLCSDEASTYSQYLQEILVMLSGREKPSQAQRLFFLANPIRFESRAERNRIDPDWDWDLLEFGQVSLHAYTDTQRWHNPVHNFIDLKVLRLLNFSADLCTLHTFLKKHRLPLSRRVHNGQTRLLRV